LAILGPHRSVNCLKGTFETIWGTHQSCDIWSKMRRQSILFFLRSQICVTSPPSRIVRGDERQHLPKGRSHGLATIEGSIYFLS